MQQTDSLELERNFHYVHEISLVGRNGLASSTRSSLRQLLIGKFCLLMRYIQLGLYVQVVSCHRGP